MSIFDILLGKGKRTESKDFSEVLLLESVKKHEGLRLKPYKCPAGKLSIGYGRNLEDCGISEQEAEMFLMNDLSRCALELYTNFPWAGQLDSARKNVLIEMVFNMGIVRFKGFKKMLAACQKGEWDKAADEMLDSAWHKQVKKRAETLAEIIRKGK